MTLFVPCCFERAFADFPVTFYLGNSIPSPSGFSTALLRPAAVPQGALAPLGPQTRGGPGGLVSAQLQLIPL